MRLRYSRGFTLLEVLVAAGIAVLLAVLCATVVKSALSSFTQTGARFRDASTLTRLSSLWYAEEDNAWAIFTPPTDVSGKSNADGHELDFYTRDESGRDRFWSYTFDASTSTLSRYKYASPGAAPVLDQRFANVASFTAHTYSLTGLQDSASPIDSPIYANATLQNGAVRFFSATAPWIAGGNQITDVRIATTEQRLEFHLSTQSAPSGYTVVLNYTPAPSPSASPAIMVWPPAIRFAAQGSGTLASTTHAPAPIAETINTFLGGGIARAASACTAEAFNTDASGNLTTQLSAGSTPPPQWYSGSALVPPMVDSDGCYNSSAYVVYENAAGIVFRDNTALTTCSDHLTASNWFPTTAAGPLAQQIFSAQSTTTALCTVGFSDSSSNASKAYAEVIEPCWAVGGICSYTMTYASDSMPGCDAATGEVSNGYTGVGRALITPSVAGSWVTTDNGNSYTFTRTSTGAVSVLVYSAYQTWTATFQRTGGYHCSSSTTYQKTNSFVISSV